MKKHSESENNAPSLRDKIIGLEERSIRKSYYPQLQQQIEQVEKNRSFLEEKTAALMNMLEDLEETRKMLADSQARYRSLVENINDVIFSLDSVGRVTYISPVIQHLSGFTPEEIVGRSFRTFVHPEDLPALTARFEHTRAEQPDTSYEFRLLDRKGAFRYVRTSSRPLLEEGRVVGLTGVMSDITENKRAEEALHQSEEFLKNIIDNIPAMVFVKDAAELRFVAFNKAGEDILGWSFEELSGKNDHDFFPEEQANFFMQKDREVLARGQMLDIAEETIKTRDGRERILHTKKIPLYDNSGKMRYLLGISEDITDRKHLEEQLLQSQKMESIGRLAGGVAHDFNNMLGVIMGSAELLRLKLPKNDPAFVYLDQISRAAERSSKITRQLLAFSRKEIVVPRAVNLNALIIESEKMLGRLISEDIKFTFRPATHLWAVKIDPSQLDQILMNLSVNARDAMPDGGSLVIETSNVHIRDDYSQYHLDARPGDYVQLTVSDTGHGIDHETREHIFEPFFTTKGVGQGTGLGLSTVYGIVIQNKGFINVYSEPGQGTTFKIYLPRLIEEVVAEEQAKPAKPVGSGTILLVEDEEMLLWMTTRLLEEIGYSVIQAQTPHAAIAICEKGEQAIDLILSDVVMPEMNGREMADRIRAFRPEMKVLFMSGYTADIVAKRGILDEGMHFISKPLEMNALHEKISEILGK